MGAQVFALISAERAKFCVLLGTCTTMGRGEDDGGDRDRDRDRDRKGEKKEKKKRRSASSESAERSREREKRRRKQQQQYVNKNRKPDGMPGTGATPGLADAGGQRMFWDGFQWVPRADTA